MKDVDNFKKFLIPSLLISIFYLIFVTYLMNFELIKDTLLGDYIFFYKINLLIALLGGMLTAMSGLGLLILILTALLTGINLTLVFKRVYLLKTDGNLKLMVGGGSLLGIVGSGCAACGLPVLGILGLSGSIVYLPLRGVELSYLSIFLLLGSLYFLTKNNNTAKSCKLNIEGGNEIASVYRN